MAIGVRHAGIIGYPLRHSVSPAMQQAAFDALGIAARYERWETPPERLAERVAGLRAADVLGANVTVPHKEAVLSLLDELEPAAGRIGAINTIVNAGGRLTGHNTDTIGFLRALREDGRFDPKGCRALLLGAGGAARAVAFSLADAGATHIAIANRTPERARALVADLARFKIHADALPWEDSAIAAALKSSGLVVNCTSLGMAHGSAEGASPLASLQIPPSVLVYDLVYNPPVTPLMAQAQRAGARALGGLPMLVYQGSAAFTLWTGQRPPEDVMFAAARRALGLV
jgi:shikimate dehydrogenase